MVFVMSDRKKEGKSAQLIADNKKKEFLSKFIREHRTQKKSCSHEWSRRTPWMALTQTRTICSLEAASLRRNHCDYSQSEAFVHEMKPVLRSFKITAVTNDD